MRVVSGRLKGKSILYLKTSITRPLKDSVKENIFNILKHSNKINVKIENSYILDLYAGVGSFGIECLSRGAKEVTFVEENEKVAKILNNNLKNLSILNHSKIINTKIDKLHEMEIKDKFNILFFDPPFADNQYLKNLYLFNKNKIFEKNHVVIIHREKRSNDKFDNFFNPIIIRKYGRSMIIFGKFN